MQKNGTIKNGHPQQKQVEGEIHSNSMNKGNHVQVKQDSDHGVKKYEREAI